MLEWKNSPRAKSLSPFLHDTHKTRPFSAALDNLRALLAPARVRFNSPAGVFFGGASPLPAAAPPRRAGELSLLLHSLALAALLLPAVNSSLTPLHGRRETRWSGPIPFPNWKPQMLLHSTGQAKGGGTSGDRSPEPATKGGLPRFQWLQFAPPSLIKNQDPKFGVEATLVGPPEIRVPETDRFGDPLAPIFNHSQGPGSGGAFGNSKGTGVGSGKPGSSGYGPGGPWGYGTSVGPPGKGGVGYPECMYCPNPAFTEEARKAKHQGAVLLRVIVLPDGRTGGVTVARGLGMGLDENAVSAVRNWKFRPALGPNGTPVAVEVFIEVTFRLL